MDLSVTIVTKLNRTCLLQARETLVLPCLGRTEQDMQENGPQFVTVEDSMSMVHASRGRIKPVVDRLLSEPAIVAGLAKATLRDTAIPWDVMVADYHRIRERIAEVFADFGDFNTRVRQKHGFRLTVGPSNRIWDTSDGKGHFIVHADADGAGGNADAPMVLTTIRSHDQYNTTIYGHNDRYRGITGRRDVVFVNSDDLAEAGLRHGDLIDVVTATGRILERQVAIAHAIARGSVAAYYTEANHLIALDDHDFESGTPSYKSVPVHLRAAVLG